MHGDPKRMTVGVETGEEVHVVVVGWHPGVVVLAEPVAVVPHVVVVEDWDDGVRVTPRGLVVVRERGDKDDDEDEDRQKEAKERRERREVKEKEIDIKVLPNGKVKVKGGD